MLIFMQAACQANGAAPHIQEPEARSRWSRYIAAVDLVAAAALPAIPAMLAAEYCKLIGHVFPRNLKLILGLRKKIMRIAANKQGSNPQGTQSVIEIFDEPFIMGARIISIGRCGALVPR